MTEDIDPEEGVPVGEYLPRTDTMWLTFHCCGPLDVACQRLMHVSIRAAVERFGPDMGVRAIARRLRCSSCGSRSVQVQIGTDPRAQEAFERQGPLPQTQAPWPDR